jgi:hypothetical protein
MVLIAFITVTCQVHNYNNSNKNANNGEDLSLQLKWVGETLR